METLFSSCKTKILIGKGGMSDTIYQSIFKKYQVLYLSTMGYGLGAIYGKAVIDVDGVFWGDELGLAQAVWVLNVKHFGPLLVDCDYQGNSFLSNEAKKVNSRLISAIKSYPTPQLKRLGEIHDYYQEIIS